MYSNFQGNFLGSLVALNTVGTPPTAPASTGNAWADVFGGVAAGALEYLNTRENRKLEQSYINKQMTPPSSLLYQPGSVGGAIGTNPWPLIALAGGALLLLMRR